MNTRAPVICYPTSPPHLDRKIAEILVYEFYKALVDICTQIKHSIWDRDARKSVFGVSDQVKRKPACEATETRPK